MKIPLMQRHPTKNVFSTQRAQEKLENKEHEPEGQSSTTGDLEMKTLKPEGKEEQEKWLQNQKETKRPKETRRTSTKES